MKFGKTIKLFLIDGDTNGRLTCELSNWTGKAYKIPRNTLKLCVDRAELITTGVYLLVSKFSDVSDRPQIYIGEAEDIYKRLNQHIREKDFWNEAIVFISKDENLNKAHIKYLENRLYQKALEVKRSVLINSNQPTLPSISESDKAEMEEFISNVFILTSTLGYFVFDELESEIEKNIDLFFISSVRGASGKGRPNSEGFLVFKGSQVANPVTNSYPRSMELLRNRLISEGEIKSENGALFLQRDYLFSSSSTAAMIIMGRSANGLVEWKTSNGLTLQNYESDENFLNKNG